MKRLLALCGIGASLAVTGATDTQSARPPTLLTYAVESSGGLCLARPDGTRRVRLTAGKDQAPSWSPNGRRVVFCAPGGRCLANPRRRCARTGRPQPHPGRRVRGSGLVAGREEHRLCVPGGPLARRHRQHRRARSRRAARRPHGLHQPPGVGAGQPAGRLRRGDRDGFGRPGQAGSWSPTPTGPDAVCSSARPPTRPGRRTARRSPTSRTRRACRRSARSSSRARTEVARVTSRPPRHRNRGRPGRPADSGLRSRA